MRPTIPRRRHAALVASAAFAAALLTAAASSPAGAQDASSVADQTIGVMHKLWGQHPGARANHAKGVVVEGNFVPGDAGARLSSASLFRTGGAPVPVIARFSDATGLPDIADGSDNARPNGIAVRLQPASGEGMDMVLNTLPFFPVATGEEFLQLLQAASASPAGAPKPTPIERFGASHPAAPRAAAAVKTPVSLARAVYNGIDAFVFVDGSGKRQPFRVRLVPVDGAKWLEGDEAAKKPANFLMDEIAARLAKEPVRFRFMAQLAKPGDQTKDPTQPWPEDRELVDLGTITLTKVSPDGDRIARETVFMPTNLPSGVEASDDPLIDARVQAYAVSFGQRAQ